MPVAYKRCLEYSQEYQRWCIALSHAPDSLSSTSRATIYSHIARIFGDVRNNIRRIPYDERCKTELYNCIDEVEAGYPLPQNLEGQVEKMRQRFEVLAQRMMPIENVGGSRSFLGHINAAMKNKLTEKLGYDLDRAAITFFESSLFRVDFSQFFDLMVNKDDELRADDTIEEIAEIFEKTHVRLKAGILPIVYSEDEMSGKSVSYVPIDQPYSLLLLKMLGALLESSGKYSLTMRTRGTGARPKTHVTREVYGGTKSQIEKKKNMVLKKRMESGRKASRRPFKVTHLIICYPKENANVAE